VDLAVEKVQTVVLLQEEAAILAEDRKDHQTDQTDQAEVLAIEVLQVKEVQADSEENVEINSLSQSN
jgi:hypothetical protein